MSIITKNVDPSTIPTPASGKTAFGTNLTSEVFIKDDTGAVTVITSGGTVTSVGVTSTGGTLTVSGSPVTSSGDIDLDVDQSALDLANIGGDLDLSTQVNGTLSIENGGTGEITAAAAFKALLTPQAGQGGKFLRTDGNDPYWDTPIFTSPLLAKGDLFTFSTADARLPVGTNGQFLAADSAETTGLKWVAAPVTSPAGGTYDIQFNNAGSFGGSDNFIYDTSTSYVWLYSADGVQGGLSHQVRSNTAAHAPQFNFGRARGTRASPSAVLNGDQLWYISGAGYDGTAFAGAPLIGSSTLENWTTSARGSQFYIQACPIGSTTRATVMRIRFLDSTTNYLQFASSAAVIGQGTGGLSFKDNATTPTTTYATINSGPSSVASTDLVRRSEFSGNENLKAPTYEYQTATASQTVFSTTVSTRAISAGKAYLQVFVNGVKQREGGSYSVTGTNEITFLTGLLAGDEVEFYSFD